MPSKRKKIPIEDVRVIDGDTLKIKNNRKLERIRLLYIDTPEVNSTNLLEHFKALEAKKYISSLLQRGRDLTIEQGVIKRDHYGRILAHVYIDDIHLQPLLLKRGLARCVIPHRARKFKSEQKYLEEFLRLEAMARKEKRGIWEYEHFNGEMINRVRNIHHQ
ncbi:thermonuclease family protein [Thermoactinomyces mirandus]|uniref:Thermonuclease family protein n=1 Tax=Thermoactinomyces mirandus TaxID=2756294 RepID=A0A7W2ASG7_9BACL|nr:thermonuclease family protein [Thermoactinomyces mirandus]MBA4603608.1 thermonuclease family protein [Thermoactinomyces mirandus]